ncbi:hypothetical protein [Paenibacillus sp. Leaf72]|uniref:hypothetical protein n=1 Tax=Paenibacillus sp. Leaf72 TaxID=1736234 RepID=UPI0006FFAFEF|nr:hypothetical protein [Paenibacillus sp. Leaf72]KQN96850.1 hypothetical protein ASF12_22535 [Paenibacillus sp. Leaf72]
MHSYNKQDYIYNQTKRLLRNFRRLIHTGNNFFTTGMGSIIQIVMITNNKVVYEVASTKKQHTIKLEKFRMAIWHMFLHRTATRKELEKFFNFNTHLMALLNAAFGSKLSKIHKMPNRMLRLTLKGTRYYFSGMEYSTADRILVSQNGGRFVLFSYFTLRDLKHEKILEIFKHCWKLNLRIIIDSGAFSIMKAHRKSPDSYNMFKYRKICLIEYSQFLISFQKYILGYFNLDVESDLAATSDNLTFLTKTVGMVPYPVWHFGMGWEELDRLVVSCQYSLIGIGGTVFIKSSKEKRSFFTELFDRYGEMQPFHWLGGSSQLLNDFEFLSADSTGFNIGRRFRRLIPLYRAQIEAPLNMNTIDCLTYNIKQMAKLEEPYFDMQMEIPLPYSAPSTV